MPPSEEYRVGQASTLVLRSNTRSPEPPWALVTSPKTSVNPPDHLAGGDSRTVGHRGPGVAGVSQWARSRLPAPSQRSNPCERSFVLTMGLRFGCSMGKSGLGSSVHLSPLTSPSYS